MSSDEPRRIDRLVKPDRSNSKYKKKPASRFRSNAELRTSKQAEPKAEPATKPIRTSKPSNEAWPRLHIPDSVPEETESISAESSKAIHESESRHTVRKKSVSVKKKIGFRRKPETSRRETERSSESKDSSKPKTASAARRRKTDSRKLHPKDSDPKKTVQKKKKYSKRYKQILLTEIIAALALLCVLIFLFTSFSPSSDTPEEPIIYETETEEPMTETEETEYPEIDIPFQPFNVESTKPGNQIEYTEIMVNDNLLSSPADYVSDGTISFGYGNTYTEAEGVLTFRGNNFRDNPTFGLANMTLNKLNSVWSADTGGLSYGNATWTGSGWTGQPLIMKWPKEVRAHMNMYDWAKSQEELVEVIYACMDGYVYFLDLQTGQKTRDSLYLGYTFKGSGALDPRGYPILYVGAGYDSNQGIARVFIINLLDCSTMYTFGNSDPFSLRGALSYFDSSPLVDAETDTLIYPGENGILYLIKLNTSYNPDMGTLSINPSRTVKWHYNSFRTAQGYWLGMEDSAAIYNGYLFVTDNGGNLMCLNLNTLQLVWTQDTLDDSNSTPVLSVEDGHLYLYVSTSFRLGWRSTTTAVVPVWKIDAESGEIVWQKDYECYTEDGVSGGVQSTIACGKKDLSDYIYVTVARTGEAYNGVLACISKTTGQVIWEHKAYYAWSSPVCVYNEDGSGKVIYCSCAGLMYLLDGKTGEVLDSLELSEGAIEASPAVYNNMAVIGTRACKIWGVELQ